MFRSVKFVVVDTCQDRRVVADPMRFARQGDARHRAPVITLRSLTTYRVEVRGTRERIIRPSCGSCKLEELPLAIGETIVRLT